VKAIENIAKRSSYQRESQISLTCIVDVGTVIESNHAFGTP
jgi:hypothetical protein